MIHYHVKITGLDELERGLGVTKDKSKLILRAAINNAAKSVRKDMEHGANKRYKLDSDRLGHGLQGFKSAGEIKKATVGLLAAYIYVKGPIGEVYDYKVSPRTYFPGSRGAPNWIKGKVKKASRLSSMSLKKSGKDKYKAFVVRYHSGHMTLAERVPGKAMRSNPKKEALKSLFSNSIPKDEEMVYQDEIEPDVYDTLEKSIEQQILRFLG